MMRVCACDASVAPSANGCQNYSHRRRPPPPTYFLMAHHKTRSRQLLMNSKGRDSQYFYRHVVYQSSVAN